MSELTRSWNDFRVKLRDTEHDAKVFVIFRMNVNTYIQTTSTIL